MSSELKAMLTGGAIVLVAVGALAGVWSMTVAPPPPTIQTAQVQANETRSEVRERMHLFLTHYLRAEQNVQAGNHDRALAHLVVMTEFAAELDNDHLRYKVPDERLKTLQTMLTTATEKVRAKDEGSLAAIRDMRAACAACHVTQNGPNFAKVFANTGAPAPTAAPAPAPATAPAATPAPAPAPAPAASGAAPAPASK